MLTDMYPRPSLSKIGRCEGHLLVIQQILPAALMSKWFSEVSVPKCNKFWHDVGLSSAQPKFFHILDLLIHFETRATEVEK